jgi:glycosyltransferase involved in cell wall biosynthesis
LFTSSGAGEGFPLAILEAAAFGLPVVGNIESGLSTLIESAGGEARKGDPGILAKAAADVLESLNERSSAAREWAEAHELGRWIEAHMSLFESLTRGLE